VTKQKTNLVKSDCPTKFSFFKALLVIFLHPVVLVLAPIITILLGFVKHSGSNLISINGWVMLSVMVLLFFVKFSYFFFRFKHYNKSINLICTFNFYVQKGTIIQVVGLFILTAMFGEIEGNGAAFLLIMWFIPMVALAIVNIINYRGLFKRFNGVDFSKQEVVGGGKYYLLGLFLAGIFIITVFSVATGENFLFNFLASNPSQRLVVLDDTSKNAKGQLKKAKCSEVSLDDIEDNLLEARRLNKHDDINGVVQQLQWSVEKLKKQSDYLKKIQISSDTKRIDIDYRIQEIELWQAQANKQFGIYDIHMNDRSTSIDSTIDSLEKTKKRIEDTLRQINCD